MRKGQINIVGLVGIGVTIALASIGSFFYQSNRTASVETRAAVLETQYVEVNKKLDQILGKLEIWETERKNNRIIETKLR